VVQERIRIRKKEKGKRRKVLERERKKGGFLEGDMFLDFIVFVF